MLLPTLADFDEGWRTAGAEVSDSGGSEHGELERLLTAKLAERDVVALADSPLFLRSPARLAYATAAILSSDQAATQAFALVASEDFARTFAEGVAGGALGAPGAAELLGSITRPVELSRAICSVVEAAAHRTTYAGGTAEGMVPVHVDLVVLHCGPRLVLLWMADAPNAFPHDERDRIVARLAPRLADPSEEPPALA